MIKRIRKYLFWILAAAALGVLLIYAFRPSPLSVDIAEVKRGDLEVTVDEDGVTMIREPYTISIPLAGRLSRVELEPGDHICRGDVLAVIDPGEPALLDARTEAEARARVNAAKANLERMEKELETARADEEQWVRYESRDKERLEMGLISEPILKDTRHRLRVARSNLAAGESALEVARFELDQAEAALIHSRALQEDESAERRFVIESPIEGVVLRTFHESSTVLPAGEPVMEIGDLEDLEVRIDVLSQDAVRIEPGQRAIIEHWGGEEEITAFVRRVEPSAFTKVSALGIDEQRVYVFADIESQEGVAERLGDGYRVEARVVVWEKEDVLKIPSGALFRDGEAWAAYKVIKDRARRQVLTIGQNNGIEAEVTEGLEDGDQVVLHPGDRVEEGTLVEGRGDQ